MREVRILPTSQDVALAAADLVTEQVRKVPASVLGVATGSTPLGLYAHLARRARDGLSFAGCRAFLLDEYVGLPPEHPERYRNVVLRELAGPVGLPADAVHAPDVDAVDLEAAAARYDAAIAASGGIDLQVLGLGADGHVAFNMPGTPPDAPTHVTTLSERTLQDNARFFGGDVGRVPRRALTQGLATIARARLLVLMVTGEAKAPALEELLRGPVGPHAPATALRTHPGLVVLADEPAASRVLVTASGTR